MRAATTSSPLPGSAPASPLQLSPSEAGGTLRIMGTPAEEGGGGKIEMARNGAFEGIDAAMMVHPADADLIRMDAIAIQELHVSTTAGPRTPPPRHRRDATRSTPPCSAT